MIVEAVVLSDASAGIGIASTQGFGRLKHLEVKWLWVQEKVLEKAIPLRKHPTETNIADLATKYLSRSRMEMLLAAGNLVLVSGERETSGEYILMNSGGTNGEYTLMQSEVNRFLFIVRLFLCVGGIPIGVFYDVFTEMLYYVHVESNGFLRDCTGTRGSGSLELEMDGRPSSCVWNFGGVKASGDIRLSVLGRERLSV